jgi:hypothetical protein
MNNEAVSIFHCKIGLDEGESYIPYETRLNWKSLFRSHKIMLHKNGNGLYRLKFDE